MIFKIFYELAELFRREKSKRLHRFITRANKWGTTKIKVVIRTKKYEIFVLLK